MEYLAHFNKYTNEKQLLKDHLHETAQMNSEAIPFEILGFQNIQWKNIKKIAQRIGLFHDIGKYTVFFQDYLQKDIHSKYSQHSQVSACILYNCLKEEYPTKKKYDENDLSNSKNIAQNLLAYMAVKYHHGNLSQIPIETDLLSENEQLNIIYENLSSIENTLKKELEIKTPVQFNLTNMDILKEKFYFKTAPHLLTSRIASEEWFFYLQLIFSILVDNDKLNSAGIQRNINTFKNPDIVTYYIREKSKTNQNKIINSKREAFRQSVLQKIKTLTDEEVKSNGIYTITAPTGIGKTLTSIQAALLLSNRLNTIHHYQPRIITAIPFINIIEQTKNDYQKLFGDEAVLIHHRFALKENKEDEEKDSNKDFLNLEAWNSEIVLTTFVQLFHSILTGKNRLLKKFNKFVGSIVILDEIQSVPEKYFPLVGWLLNEMSNYYGTKFILMTATKPKIIEFANKLSENKTEIKAIELFENHQNYFTTQKRTQLIPVLKDKLTTDNLIDFANEKYTGEGSLLIVVNTIRRSLEVYEALKNQYEDSDVEILYLSTNIIPLSRKKVIQKARELLDPENKKNMIMVSTQTIEAGVDLDFDMGIRDLAPVASIIQTAGRINREGKKEIHRPLYIVNIEDDCEKVYSMSKTYNSRNMLDRVINEEDYFNTIEAYYANQLNVTALDESVHIIEDGIKKLNYEKIEKFELIKNLPGIVDVFVEADNQATELAEQYEKTRKALKEASKELKYKYKIKLKEILKKMGNYIISVRSNRLKDGNNPPEFFHRNGIDADFLWIPPDDDLEIYYSKETGFKDESGSAFIF